MVKQSTFELLSRLVAIHSSFPHEQELSAYLKRYLEERGFTVDTVATMGQRNNLVATFGSAEKYLAFYGHMDTVEADGHYTHNPLKIRRVGRHAYGLGVADMKGGITAILELADFASAKNLPVKIIFGVDEEDISRGAHDLVESGLLKDIAFMVSGESGQVTRSKQPYSLVFGRRGRVAIQFSVRGRKTHAAVRKGSVNAIDQASLLISKLHTIRFPRDKRFGRTDLVIHHIDGSTDSFSVPDVCSFVLSGLTTPEVKNKEVLQKLKDLAKKLGVDATIKMQSRVTPYPESYRVDPKNAFLRQLTTQLFDKNSVKPIFTASVADENIFANRLAIPVISVGPVGGGDHTASEWVDLGSIDAAAVCYQKILELFHDQNSGDRKSR